MEKQKTEATNEPFDENSKSRNRYHNNRVLGIPSNLKKQPSSLKLELTASKTYPHNVKRCSQHNVNQKSINFAKDFKRNDKINYQNTGRVSVGNVCVQNLDKSVDDRTLQDIFSAFGNLSICKVVMDEENNSKGYGYVNFENLSSAHSAIQNVNGMIINGKKVSVYKSFARRESIGEKTGGLTIKFTGKVWGEMNHCKDKISDSVNSKMEQKSNANSEISELQKKALYYRSKRLQKQSSELPKQAFQKQSCRNISEKVLDNKGKAKDYKVLNRIKNLISKRSDEILLTILNDSTEFRCFLEQDVERDLMAFIIIALGKAVSSCMSKHISALLNKISNSDNFWKCAVKYLTSFQIYPSKQHHFDSLTSLIDFLIKFQMYCASSSFDTVMILLPILKSACQMCFSHSSDVYSEVSRALDELETRHVTFLKKCSLLPKYPSHKEQVQLEEPPENYRCIPILPYAEDFRCTSAFIRPNLVNGNYRDTEHYLDVQFRLLREDYIKPIRDGIAEYIRLKSCGKSVKQCKDIKVYENVQIISQQVVQAGLVHIALFNEANFAYIKWASSKRFLTGSLLCFSSDDFQTILFASVAERKVKELKKGKLMLRFEELTDEILNFSPLRKFVVIETAGYFESYRHNLKALTELNETKLPMKRYIVSVEKDVLKPMYLSDDTVYDMQPLLIPLDPKFITIGRGGCTTYKYPSGINRRAKEIRVLNDSSWPTCTDFNLDLTQYTALKAAITKEFAVIQGPPGTGKTFIGLRIIQLILHNLNKWRKDPGSLPVLVVCQTNHALDQFLEEISIFSNRIVRIGGGSKNESLEKYQLHNLKRRMKQDNKIPFYIFSNIKEKRNELTQLRKDIDKRNSAIEKSYDSVLSQSELGSCMSADQFYSLTKPHNYRHGNIMYWLGILEETFDDGSSDGEEDVVENVVENDLWLDLHDREFVDISLSSESGSEVSIPYHWHMLRNMKVYKFEITKYVSCILNSCYPLMESEANNIDNVWLLNVSLRWKLYKHWVQRYVVDKQNEHVKVMERFQIKHAYMLEHEMVTRRIKLINACLRSSLSSVFSEHVLKDYISSHHLKSLRSSVHAKENKTLMYCWLELKCKDQNKMEDRIEVVERLMTTAFSFREDFERCSYNSVDFTCDTEDEDEVEYIEAQRKFDSEEYADVSFNVPTQITKTFIPSLVKEWKFQGDKNTIRKSIREKLNNYEAMPETEAIAILDVWNIPTSKRWQLYKFWLQVFIQNEQKKIYELLIRFREVYKQFCELRSLEDICVCSNAHVIGMTTTGAAKYKHIIQPLNPTIVVVEEAAEILESNLVTSLAPCTQHVILIGDHQQLRPSPTVHMLSVKYDLNVSLFERMVKNGLQCYQLGIQHRMRPGISALLVPHIYDHLENHESVYSFENIRGVTRNVFFITHDFRELQAKDSKSRVNKHEARFLIKLCRYFICQNYDPSKITILTTYSGQLVVLKELAKGIVDGVKIKVVDNYQGEENDIILVSFVRSNENGEIGFLKTSNRVCVALSRAKKGLYCIGNFQLLAEKSNLWRKITNVLKDRNDLGISLQLVCQNHPDTKTAIAKAEDFDSAPEGGCTLKCEYQMLCGHICPLACHPYNKEHKDIYCSMPCNRKCVEGHLCKKQCSQKCGPCKVLISKTFDDCGHETPVNCHLKEHIICPKPCERLLPCGHKCPNLCRDDCATLCVELCSITSLLCGHNVKVKCCYINDVDFLSKICNEPCNIPLACQHHCKGTCGGCSQGQSHIICSQKCKKILICGHKCKSLCFEECNPCIVQIVKKQESCNHEVTVECHLRDEEVKCSVLCKRILPCGHETSMKCCLKVEEVKCSKLVKKHLLCGHDMTAKCYLKEEEVKCLNPCKKLLSCGHKCIKLCSETCTIDCREMCVKTSVFCGHDVKGECFRADNVEYLTKCIAPCKTELSCQHICKGTCRTCHQGRLHVACHQKCKRFLLCGHKCKSVCSKSCPPCRQSCDNWCTHRKCNKKCNELCEKCNEPCDWVCPHKKCSRFCGEQCDRSPCDEPCPKLLDCGHYCMGFCGEPCPKQCRTCHEREVTEIFFGYENQNGARFICLEDCNHSFEVNGITQWLNESASETREVQAKVCPKCKTVIRRNYRFGNMIKSCVEDIEKVKKYTMEERGIRATQQKKIVSLISFKKNYIRMKSYFYNIEKALSYKKRTWEELVVIENFLSMIDSFVNATTFTGWNYTPNTYFNDSISKSIVELKSYAASTKSRLISIFLDDYLTASEQQLNEISWEIHRLELVGQLLLFASSELKAKSSFLKFFASNSNRNIESEWRNLINCVMTYSSFRDTDLKTFTSEFKAFAGKFAANVFITSKDKQQIVGRSNQSAGEFYKCLNGHVFRFLRNSAAVKQILCDECEIHLCQLKS